MYVCNFDYAFVHRQAEKILKFKDAMMSTYQYYIKQLTDSGKFNPDFNNSWDNFLHILGTILDENAIPK